MLEGWLVSLALLFCVLAPSEALASACGDLNNDGNVATADVVLLFRAVLEEPDPAPLCGAKEP